MLWWLAETTVVAAALAVVVALLCRGLRPRPAVRHALWLVVLLKLLTPPLFAWPWPAGVPQPTPQESPRPPPVETPAEPIVDQAPAPPEALVFAPPSEPIDDPPPPPVVDPAPVAPEPAAVAAAVEGLSSATPPTWPEWSAFPLAVVWIAGALLMALVQLVRVVRFRRQVSRGTSAPESLVALVGDVAARLGVRPPPVVVVPRLASPMVWSLGPPRLLWPAALLERLSPDSERAAVVHELAHLRRRDHWVGWLELIAGCVWWWNPLFRLVRRQLGRAAELACDAWVIETLPAARRAYAEALLAVCELVSRRAAPAPALGMGGTRQEIERRLTMILRESVPSRAPVRALFGVVLLAAIALPGFSDGQQPAASGPPGNIKADPNFVPSAGPLNATKPGGDERDQRLQKLEANLEALLKEVKELRGGSPSQTPKKTDVKPADPNKPTTSSATDKNLWSNHKPGNQAYPPYANFYSSQVAPGQPGQSIHLERVSYTLPKEKAEALAVLLKDLKAPVLETQVKADGIVVTTTPAAQRIVGEFVGLLIGKSSATLNDATLQYRDYSVPAPK